MPSAKQAPNYGASKKVGKLPSVKRKKVKSEAPASISQVAAIRRSLGLKRDLFSRLTGFSTRAIAGWEQGQRVSEPAIRRMREFKRFRDRLSQVIDSAAIPQWLLEPNQAFDGLKPIEVIERGEIDRLWDMIFHLESGIAS